MRVMKPIWCTVYLQFIQSLYLYMFRVWPADSQLKRTTRNNCCIYTSLPPDDGQLARPKHVEVLWLDKLKINSASSCFHYTQKKKENLTKWNKEKAKTEKGRAWRKAQNTFLSSAPPIHKRALVCLKFVRLRRLAFLRNGVKCIFNILLTARRSLSI
jgi:hypothetical protein